MERRWFQIDDIHVMDGRLRAPVASKVDEIAESILEVGIMNPPAVRIMPSIMIDGEEWLNTPVLIAGRHRLLALKKIGRDTVECAIFEVDDIDAELMEIDENLKRADLGEPELGLHLTRRKELYLRKHPETANGAVGNGRAKVSENWKPTSGEPANRFTLEAAHASGRAESTVALSISRVAKLGRDNSRRIIGTSLAKGVEMDALIKLPEDEREDLIARAASGEVVSARPAAVPRPVPADQALNVIAKGIVADSHADEDEEERQFWVFFASLSPAVQRKVIAKFKAR